MPWATWSTINAIASICMLSSALYLRNIRDDVTEMFSGASALRQSSFWLFTSSSIPTGPISTIIKEIWLLSTSSLTASNPWSFLKSPLCTSCRADCLQRSLTPQPMPRTKSLSWDHSDWTLSFHSLSSSSQPRAHGVSLWKDFTTCKWPSRRA